MTFFVSLHQLKPTAWSNASLYRQPPPLAIRHDMSQHLWMERIWKIREQMKSRTMSFDIPKHVIRSWYQIYCPLSDIVMGEAMPVRRSHILVHFPKVFFMKIYPSFVSTSIVALNFGNYKQKTERLSPNRGNRYKLDSCIYCRWGASARNIQTVRRGRRLKLEK